ncbi:hypothetical protein R3P38DRAFT_2804295 [Favolaschia claudopus]|uniref:Uncharacterized protein n=1 Tax=Favolaschia claudopus TaxID=2862362 RepID=A0AAV9ZQZ6_9AGAR
MNDSEQYWEDEYDLDNPVQATSRNPVALFLDLEADVQSDAEEEQEHDDEHADDTSDPPPPPVALRADESNVSEAAKLAALARHIEDRYSARRLSIDDGHSTHVPTPLFEKILTNGFILGGFKIQNNKMSYQ